ncbi:MAG: DUF2309 family protein, partial [Cyanobacteria bacterium REEB65]|nr:DUF2309 family protein [Cyanobacteria bacterium REEB65]
MTSPMDREARRMELRGIVRVAGEVIAQYWPMRTFVHHNPLSGLEHLHFEQAVQLGTRFLGGQGYLSSQTYRGFLRSGRIQMAHLDQALLGRIRSESVRIGGQRVTHGQLLRTCLTHGLSEVSDGAAERPGKDGLDPRWVGALADRLSGAIWSQAVADRVQSIVQADRDALGRFVTLSDWCDRTLGTAIVAQVNDELIKWCEAFLDEDHATWPMPNRELGFYQAWRSLAIHQWAPCGIPDSRAKILALPEDPEDAVLESLDILGIPDDLRQDYLALQLTALPGWSGFIKWRAEQRDYAWQRAYPISLVKLLAVRLWYARELSQLACRHPLGIRASYGDAVEFMQANPHEYFLRKESVAGRLPAYHAERAGRLQAGRRDDWQALAEHLQQDQGP